MKTYIITCVAAIMMITSAIAQNNSDHRFNIRGYVLDENKQAISNQLVKVYKGRILKETGSTDSTGFYSLNINVLNSGTQQVFRIRTGTQEAEFLATIDAESQQTTSTHKVNFVAGKFVQGDLGEFFIPTWIYPVTGFLIISFLAVKLEKRRKKKLQLKKNHLSGRSSSSSHRAKHKRRKNK